MAQNGTRTLAAASRSVRLGEVLERRVRIGEGAFHRRSPGAVMTAVEFSLALGFIKSTFGLVLQLSIGARQPKLTSNELFRLCAAVDDATCHRDRAIAVNALAKCGFRVSRA